MTSYNFSFVKDLAQVQMNSYNVSLFKDLAQVQVNSNSCFSNELTQVHVNS